MFEADSLIADGQIRFGDAAPPGYWGFAQLIGHALVALCFESPQHVVVGLFFGCALVNHLRHTNVSMVEFRRFSSDLKAYECASRMPHQVNLFATKALAQIAA